MKLYLIRHGSTKGNAETRYVGITDEGLSEEGRSGLEVLHRKLQGIKADRLLVSPMLRCRETAEVLFPKQEYEIVEDFRECDFGEFEYKNYQELNGNPDYQRWIDSGGKIAFPGGESPDEFRERCQQAFLEEIRKIKDVETVAIIVHGGTIMAILEGFSLPHRDYFEWQIGNGNGYAGEITNTDTNEDVNKDRMGQFAIENVEKLIW